MQDQSESHLGPAERPRLGEFLSKVQLRPKVGGPSKVPDLERGDQNETLSRLRAWVQPQGLNWGPAGPGT